MTDYMIEWSAGQDEDYSSEDDAKVYKNPRNSPSAECPRDEEHAEFLVSDLFYKNYFLLKCDVY